MVDQTSILTSPRVEMERFMGHPEDGTTALVHRVRISTALTGFQLLPRVSVHETSRDQQGTGANSLLYATSPLLESGSSIVLQLDSSEGRDRYLFLTLHAVDPRYGTIGFVAQGDINPWEEVGLFPRPIQPLPAPSPAGEE
jgi:hypothetical protein